MPFVVKAKPPTGTRVKVTVEADSIELYDLKKLFVKEDPDMFHAATRFELYYNDDATGVEKMLSDDVVSAASLPSDLYIKFNQGACVCGGVWVCSDECAASCMLACSRARVPLLNIVCAWGRM
jgi:hypothetical protein